MITIMLLDHNEFTQTVVARLVAQCLTDADHAATVTVESPGEVFQVTT